MRLFLLFILISTTLHLLFIAFVPSFGIAKTYEKVTPVLVELVDVRKKVIPEVPERRLSAAPSLVTPNTNPKPVDVAPKIKNVDVDKSEGRGDELPLVLPDIEIPKSATEADPLLPAPYIKDIAKDSNPETFKGTNVDSELKSQDSARKSNVDSNLGKSNKEGSVTGNDIGQDVFDYDEKPTNNRQLVFVPTQPVFSLPNDTSIKVKFNIDKSGATRDIQLVTRNQQVVEDIARDYVSKLKFNSVLYDKVDSSQITIYFKVKKR